MDGSTAAFLLHSTDFSTRAEPSGGIYYIEDFDLEPDYEADATRQDHIIVHADPILTVADVAAAREAGRLAGLQAALDDAHLLQTQIQAAATQSLADALVAAQAALTKVARQTAEEGARIAMALLQAAVPNLMKQHAVLETEDVCRALLSGVSLEPELRVRTHPEMADQVRELLARLLPHGSAILSVTADTALAPGDLHVAWRDGHATRDTGRIWAAMREALAPLNLPAIEELCRGYQS